ncbi:hypothetical protein [Pelagibacterium luteolum]|uniref:Uncharacterized protein n=1 Tax=Pelagibacterium luteolum TaxID=440168 RepID=A0A1G7ZIS3_9HYPH|nr:hypothetical protein [Pelagibacterium luteolum]SDH07990.1 hypothetical protein SAMN04487974_12013 [Pelagibacterium luteolum]
MSATETNPVGKAGDALNRAIAMVSAIHLAMESAETEYDQQCIADTLFEAREKMLDAQGLLGMHKDGPRT